MAPELYSAILEDLDFRTSQASDAYSFGMTILEMITLQHPFPEYRTADSAAQQALRGARPPRPADVANLNPSILDRLYQLLQTMWAHKSESRPRINVVLVALREISSLMPPMASSEGLIDSGRARGDTLNSEGGDGDWVFLDGEEWRE